MFRVRTERWLLVAIVILIIAFACIPDPRKSAARAEYGIEQLSYDRFLSTTCARLMPIGVAPNVYGACVDRQDMGWRWMLRALEIQHQCLSDARRHDASNATIDMDMASKCVMIRLGQIINDPSPTQVAPLAEGLFTRFKNELAADARAR